MLLVFRLDSLQLFINMYSASGCCIGEPERKKAIEMRPQSLVIPQPLKENRHFLGNFQIITTNHQLRFFTPVRYSPGHRTLLQNNTNSVKLNYLT